VVPGMEEREGAEKWIQTSTETDVDRDRRSLGRTSFHD